MLYYRHNSEYIPPKFKLIRPMMEVEKDDSQYVCIKTNSNGLNRLKDLFYQNLCHTLPIYIEKPHYLVYVESHVLLSTIDFNIQMREFEYVVQSKINTSVPKLFYDLVFGDIPCDFDTYNSLKHTRNYYGHLQSACENDIDPNPYEIVDVNDLYATDPELELYFSFHNFTFYHSINFIDLFKLTSHEYAKAYYFEGEHIREEYEYIFCPNALLTKPTIAQTADAEQNELFLKWMNSVQEQYKLIHDINEMYSSRYTYDLLPTKTVYSTKVRCNVMQILEFCFWIGSAGDEDQRYMFDSDIGINMLAFLSHYRHIESVDKFLNFHEECYDYYKQLVDYRNQKIKQFSILLENNN